MKSVRLQTLLHAAILTIVCTTGGSAEEKITNTVSKQELQAKIEYCLSWPVGPRFSWSLSHATTRGAADRVS
jgi:hypothetical protein